jgi:hypothetical protein
MHDNYIAVVTRSEERRELGLFPSELLFPFNSSSALSVAAAERKALAMTRRFDVASLALYAPCELVDYPLVGELKEGN